MIAAACVVLASACTTEAPNSQTAVKVEIVRTEDGFQLLRGGQPYLIKGAGLEYGDIASLAEHGGNSIRNWTTRNEVETAQEVLDKALAHGVTVALCLPMQAERWGFDYDDPDAVAAQLEAFREEVIRYRDHPALLAWIIGNELNFDYTNPKVYDAVNDISKMIHELDPNHPTTTTIAGIGENVLRDIEERAPDLDFVSFQVYGELAILPEFIRESDYDGPFFVTEWGAIGHWEMPRTDWGAPIEMTSTEKASVYLEGYRDRIQPLASQLVGSYAFLWGQKQERTPTWFGMFTEDGEETETVDVMHYIWNGTWPDNRSPHVAGLSLDEGSAHDSVTIRAGNRYDAIFDVTDPDGDPLTYRWEVKPESDTRQVGGDFEESIASRDGLVENASSSNVVVTAPTEAGAYRLFAYAYDGQGNAAHANIPFRVEN
jgi:hypothetical protein